MFDLDAPWELHGQVALRPEPFGALAYHYGTRRLSFLKEPALAQVVQDLARQPSARHALAAAGVEPARQARYARALETLAATSMIRLRRSAP